TTIQQIIAVSDLAPQASDFGVSTAEDTPVAVRLSATDAPGESLTFVIFSPPQHGILSGTAPNLFYTPDADFNGVDSFVYLAFDGLLTSPPATVSLSVTPVNDAPRFTIGPNQKVPDGSGTIVIAGWATHMLAAPSDEAKQVLHFVVDSDEPQIFATPPAIDQDGNLTFKPQANVRGTADVTVSLVDDGGTIDGGANSSPPQHFT